MPINKPKSCIFCGELGNISKEHFWPEWLAPHIHTTGDGRNISEIHAAEGKNQQTLQRRRVRPGNVITKKIRVVCKNCNNRWMSELEANVKPTILNLLVSNKTTLTEEEVATLSLWITVKTIVGEHWEENLSLTPINDRYLIYKNKIIPDYFQIFLGFHSFKDQAAYKRQSTTVSFDKNGPDPTLPNNIQRNIQIVCFLIGRLFIYVASARVTGFNMSTLSPTGMLRLWPPQGASLDLNSLMPMEKDLVDAAANKLNMLISSPTVIYGGSLPSQNEILTTPTNP